jgi:glutamyl/glutaminyl-tRNA synthetase
MDGPRIILLVSSMTILWRLVMSSEERYTPSVLDLQQEWLPSTPKHLVLYDAFGWKPPVFVHLPLLHSMSGAKLSKRQTKLQGTHRVKDFESNGTLPEALVNYVALFGWSSNTNSDVMSMDDMIAQVHPLQKSADG